MVENITTTYMRRNLLPTAFVGLLYVLAVAVAIIRSWAILGIIGSVEILNN